MQIESRNPATGKLIARYKLISDDEINSRLDKSTVAFKSWRAQSLEERSQLAAAAGKILKSQLEDLSILMTEEMGKPIAQSRSEINKCVWLCAYYAENATAFLADEYIESDASESFVSYQPLGTVLAVMPWNFPFWQVFRFAIPALTAGNVGLLKHASNVPGCGEAIERVFADAGYPSGVFQNLIADKEQITRIIKDRRVHAVTLTGSTGAGKSIAATAGGALKKTVLELGGSDPYVILSDANVEKAVETCVTSRLINSGQSCIAAKRFIVVEDQLEKFTSAFVAAMKSKNVGDPEREETEVGPMARTDLRDDLHRQVLRSVADGAVLLTGGTPPDGPGAFYPPTVLTNVKPGMAAFDEELFGPVAAIISASDEQHAIDLANQSDFGLGAAVFTNDIQKGRQIARTGLNAGACFVNAYVKSDPRLPFGGIKDSGYGRELSQHGIREFTNVKTVYVAREKEKAHNR